MRINVTNLSRVFPDADRREQKETGKLREEMGLFIYASQKPRTMLNGLIFLRRKFMLPFLSVVMLSASAEPEPGKNISIKGIVTTSDGIPAPDVTIQLKGTSKGTVTDENGVFEFYRLSPGNHTIVLSLVGYETIQRQVLVEEGKTATINIQLAFSRTQLAAVVVQSNRNPYSQRKMSSSLRLQEPVIQAPQNIQIVTTRALADQQVLSMSDGVLRNVSGAMRLEHWGDLYANIHMRGTQVSAFRNGMNVATSSWSPLTEDMSIVDHIEFVKGPAGFMMSVGDPAGLYNVVTKKPTGETKGEVNFTTGSFDLYRASADLQGKLDKQNRLLYRLNVTGQTQNSFRPYEYNNRLIIDPVVSYQLDDQTLITAEYLLHHVKSSDVGSYYVFSTKGYGVLPRNFTTLDPGIEPTLINDQSLTLNLQHKFNGSWKLTVQGAYLSYTQQGSDLWPVSVGADSMVRGISVWDAASTAKIGQAFVNGEFNTGSVRHRVLAGLDANDKEYLADWNQYHSLDTDSAQFVYASPDYGNPSNGYPVWDRTKPLAQRAGLYGTISQRYVGFYAQDELGMIDNKLRVTIAGRYTYIKENDYNSFATHQKLTPRLGLSFSIDKLTSVYALYDQSMLPQSGTKKDGSEVKPLDGNNLEIGIKKDFFGGRVSSTLSAYRITRTNVNSNDPSDPTGRYIVQLGETLSQGIEFDLRGEIIHGLTATANYALTDSRITKADNSEEGQKTIGQKVPGFAKHTANAWVNYKITEGALQGLGFSAGFTFLGTRSTWTWGGSGTDALPDYTKLDGGIFWEHEKIRIQFNLYNIANTYLYSGAAFDNYYYWQAEAGTNWRLGISYKF